MASFEDDEDKEGTSAPLDPLAQAVLDKLDTMSLEEMLAAGRKEALKQLVAKVYLGQASHQELAILRNMLKDNGMVMLAPPPTINGEPVRPALPPQPVPLPALPEPDYDDE